jgi:hypothetical protein
MSVADDKGELVQLFRGPHLRGAVLAAFPDLTPQLDADVDIHGIVATLERAVMGALDVGDTARARAIGATLGTVLDRHDLDPDIPNAVAISFVEPDALQATTHGRQVWQDLPERVRQLILANKNRT